MTIIAERGLFVRLLVQSGKFEAAAAEALADALDAALREPATKADVQELRSELKVDMQALRGEMAAHRSELKLEILDLRKDLGALSDKLLIRFGGVLVVLLGLLFAALRLT